MSDAVLNLIVIRSADLDRAHRFYSALGIRLDRERHGSGPEHLVGIAGSVTFEVYPLADAMSTIGVRLGFRVHSMADAVAACRFQSGWVPLFRASGDQRAGCDVNHEVMARS